MALHTATKGGSWSDTTVWDTGTVPTSADDVELDNYTITGVPGMECRNIQNTNGGVLNVWDPGETLLCERIYGLSGSRCIYAQRGGKVEATVGFYGTNAFAAYARFGGVLMGDSYGGSSSGVSVNSGAAHIGDSHGSDVTANSYGSNLYSGGMSFGNAYGGTQGHGIAVTYGGLFVGSAIASSAMMGAVCVEGFLVMDLVAPNGSMLAATADEDSFVGVGPNVDEATEMHNYGTYQTMPTVLADMFSLINSGGGSTLIVVDD